MQAAPAPQLHPDLPALLEKIHAIGRDIVAPNANAVDRDARFPHESFNALKAEKLLSSYIPSELGGMGLSISDQSKICEALAHYCASTAMIYAMHQIQIACIVHHTMSNEFFRSYMREIVTKQYLIASATTELGIGGDVRSSLCAVNIEGDTFTLDKQAPVISYAAAADAILVTCRQSPEAGRNDQSVVLVRKEDVTLEEISGWDTMGFRGTCSNGFSLRSRGDARQVFPGPYADIHRKTQQPYSHIVWSSLWLGLAQSAMNNARASVRAEARKNPGTLPPTALRLAELDSVLFSMRAGVQQCVLDYHQRLISNDEEAFSDFGFNLRVSNLKIRTSELVIEVVSKAMMICGIAAYRNDSKLSLNRQLRDAYGAALMVNNDRILGQSSAIQIMQKGD
ncbi:MAG: acyl-CoA dehydrogenase family protein [Spongiibacteraceae bacterium]